MNGEESMIADQLNLRRYWWLQQSLKSWWYERVLNFFGTILYLNIIKVSFQKMCCIDRQQICSIEIGQSVILLAPKASEASWGLSIFSRGFKWLLLCVCVSGYCNWVCHCCVCGKEVTVIECAIVDLIIVSLQKYGQLII